MLLPFLHSPVSKIQHQLPPTRTQFALVSFDRWQQQVLMHRFLKRILAWPRLVTKTLAGLMSRWMMPSE